MVTAYMSLQNFWSCFNSTVFINYVTNDRSGPLLQIRSHLMISVYCFFYYRPMYVNSNDTKEPYGMQLITQLLRDSLENILKVS